MSLLLTLSIKAENDLLTLKEILEFNQELININDRMKDEIKNAKQISHKFKDLLKYDKKMKAHIHLLRNYDKISQSPTEYHEKEIQISHNGENHPNLTHTFLIKESKLVFTASKSVILTGFSIPNISKISPCLPKSYKVLFNSRHGANIETTEYNLKKGYFDFPTPILGSFLEIEPIPKMENFCFPSFKLFGIEIE